MGSPSILYFGLLLFVTVEITEATTLTVSNSRTGASCVGDHLLFTCAANKTTLLSWLVEPVFTNDNPLSFGSQDNTGKTFSRNGFIATLTYIAPNMQYYDMVSTLEVTVYTSLNGSRVWCYVSRNDDVFYDILVKGPTLSLYGLNYTVLHSGLLNVIVCITWNMNSQSDIATNELSISIYSADTEQTIPVHSNETKAILTLDYNMNYNISVTAVNCGKEIKADNNISFMQIGCDHPRPPDSGTIKPYHSLAEGSEITYHCNTGYAPHEEMTAVCTHQGVWSHNANELKCLRDCGAPHPPLNGYVEPYNSTVEGGEVFYQCREGYSPSDVRMRAVCTAEGVWNPNPAHLSCTVDCGAPIPPKNGSVEPYNSTSAGALVYYKCDPDFDPEERKEAVCSEDGMWRPSPSELMCSPGGELKVYHNTILITVIPPTGTVSVIVLLLLCALLLCLLFYWRKRKLNIKSAIDIPLPEIPVVSNTKSDPLYDPLYEEIPGQEGVIMTDNDAYEHRCHPDKQIHMQV